MISQIKAFLNNPSDQQDGENVNLSKYKIGIAILIALLVALMLGLFWQFFFSFKNETVASRAIIVKQVRDVSELTTAIFETEDVIDISRKEGITESKLIYIAHGSVRVGIDLGEFQDSDVQVEGKKVTVSLPVLKVLDTKLDVNQSRLYDYNKGFLSLGPDLVKLQESALRESIRKIEQASCKEWLMKTANDRVQQTAQSFLNQLLNNKGYTVSVKIQISNDDTCPKNT